MELRRQFDGGSENLWTENQRFDVRRDGRRVRLVLHTDHTKRSGGAQVHVEVATPEQSFDLFKRESDPKWTRAIAGSTGTKLDAFRSWESISQKIGLLGLSYLSSWADPTFLAEKPVITGLDQIEKDGHTLWRVEIELKTRSIWEDKQTGWLLLAPEANWTLQAQEMEIAMKEGESHTSRTTLTYGPDSEGIPILRELKRSNEGDIRLSSTINVTALEFGPTPAEEFTPQAFGVDPSELDDPRAAPWPVRITAGGSLISLVGGLVLLVLAGYLRPDVKTVEPGKSPP